MENNKKVLFLEIHFQCHFPHAPSSSMTQLDPFDLLLLLAQRKKEQKKERKKERKNERKKERTNEKRKNKRKKERKKEREKERTKERTKERLLGGVFLLQGKSVKGTAVCYLDNDS